MEWLDFIAIFLGDVGVGWGLHSVLVLLFPCRCQVLGRTLFVV